MTFSDLELPIVYIVIGFFLLLFTPPRGLGIGYRTKRSKKSKESWAYANRLFGGLLVITTTTIILIMFITTITFQQYDYLLSRIYFWINASIFVILSLITELRLKSKFH